MELTNEQKIVRAFYDASLTLLGTEVSHNLDQLEKKRKLHSSNLLRILKKANKELNKVNPDLEILKALTETINEEINKIPKS